MKQKNIIGYRFTYVACTIFVPIILYFYINQAVLHELQGECQGDGTLKIYVYYNAINNAKECNHFIDYCIALR